MDIKQLKDMGAFVPDAPVKKAVKWKQGKKQVEFEVFVRASSYADIELRLSADATQSKAAITVAESIVDAEGKPVFTYEDAARLKPTFLRVLLSAIAQVNDAEAETAGKS